MTDRTPWAGCAPRLCQKALKERIEELLRGKRYKSPNGARGAVVYEQELPIPEGNEDDWDAPTAPAPFVVVRTESGRIPDDDSPQNIEFSVILCAYDDSGERAGWQDVVNMRETIVQAMCERPYFGGVYTVLKPITWLMQQDDTHPYYYGVLTLKCTAPAMSQDEALSALL